MLWRHHLLTIPQARDNNGATGTPGHPHLVPLPWAGSCRWRVPALTSHLHPTPIDPIAEDRRSFPPHECRKRPGPFHGERTDTAALECLQFGPQQQMGASNTGWLSCLQPGLAPGTCPCTYPGNHHPIRPGIFFPLAVLAPVLGMAVVVTCDMAVARTWEIPQSPSPGTIEGPGARTKEDP